MPQNSDKLSSDDADDKEKVTESNEIEKTDIQDEDVLLLQKTLEEEKAKAEKYLANWQRAQADYANLKRRGEQEKEDAKLFSNTTLILSLLPVIDDMERALDLASVKKPGHTWVEGIGLILRKFKTILEAQGLSEINALGQQFTAELHEAVMRAPGEEGVIIQELQKGYKIKDRVIRPSMVVVGQGEDKEEIKEEKQ